MSKRTAAARGTIRSTLTRTAVGLVVIAAAIIGTLAYQSAWSRASSFSEGRLPSARRVVPPPPTLSAPAFSEGHRGDHGGATRGDAPVTELDGALPDGVRVFDDEYPGVANLDPGLRRAMREAATAAADAGIEIYVNSGWRSSEYQRRLFREAVARYGGEEAAARWVATAETSAHVSGDAVDIGPFRATAWLSEHGAKYGLCQIYRNEPWHYELRAEAIARGCPPMYADSAHDPFIQR